MTYKASLKDNSIIVYKEDGSVLGSIIRDSNLDFTEVILNGTRYYINSNNWKVEILKDNDVITQLDINKLSGNIRFSHSNLTLKSAHSIKWGSKLVDINNNMLLKIRHDNLWRDTNNYTIETSALKINELEVLLSLYGHLQGSKMKTNAILAVGAIIIAILGVSFLF